MSEPKKQWTPEIGAKCEFTWGAKICSGTCFYHGETQNGSYIMELETGHLTSSKYYGDIEFRPIKSEAEKQRDKQIEAISESLSAQGIDLNYLSRKTAAERLYNAGCRMTHLLTKLDAERLWCGAAEMPVEVKTLHEFARAIEAHILGEN